MKFCVLISSCLLAVCFVNVQGQEITDDLHCYSSVSNVCGRVSGKNVQFKCNARYGGVDQVMKDIHSFAQTHISASFQYLLMSSYFGNYKVNRDGFAKLYRKLSDAAWENSLKLVKYMGHRGDMMNFDAPVDKNFTNIELKGNAYNLHELSSLSVALDMEKITAQMAEKIHSDASKHEVLYHDAETVNFLEKEFIHESSENIRALSGYANDLHQFIKSGSDKTLAIYLFDEYLQKKLV